MLLGGAILAVRRLAVMAGDRATGDSRALAQRGFPPVLALAVLGATGASGCRQGDSRSDSSDVPGERDVGRAAHHVRVALAGLHRCGIDGCEVHESISSPAVANLADIPEQPCRQS